MTLVNQSGVKDAAQPFRVSAHFYKALDQRVLGIIIEAKRRAEANGRTTIMPQDV
jgi:histone H3/H4